jgi:phosphoglycolate phosphatase
MGPPIAHHLAEAYGFNEADTQTAYRHFRSYYETRGIHECQLYPGIENVLTALCDAGKTIYIATSKPEHQAFRILKSMGLFDLFTGVFGGKHDEGVFTKDQVLMRAAAMIGTMPDHAVMVGDRYHDILGGRHVGLDTLGVLYGYGSFDELKEAGSDMIAEIPGDLPELLMEDVR